MRWTQSRRRRAGLALVLALGLLPGGAFASTGFNPQAAQPTSGGGYVDRSGFGELVYRSIIEGWWVGMELGTSAVDFNTDPATSGRVALGGVIGAAAGLAIPLLLSRGEVRSGDVVFMGAAQGLGMANGFFIPFTIQLAGCQGSVTGCALLQTSTPFRIDTAVSGVLSLAFGGATILVSQQFNFTPGQAEAMGSASLWGALVGWMVVNAIPNIYNTPSAVAGSIIGMADVGFVSAFLLRDYFDVDRSRLWFMDLGVAVGSGLGIAVVYFVNPRLDSSTAVSIGVLAGAAAGWAVAYYATTGLDGFKQSAPADKAAVSLGSPSLRPLVSMARGENAVGLQLDLIQGRF